MSRLAASVGGCRALALDSESDSLYHYFEKVCLVQLATDRGEAALVDPLALRDLSPLGPVLADPAVLKVLHGADYDVTTLKRDFGFRFASLFDTMIAARLLGFREIGLQALARAELGVELSKASQRDDWSRRPLTRAQEAYALADVRHLLSLHERLVEKLKAAGRVEWVLEECEAVAALEPARRLKDPEAYQDVKGARRLSRRSLAALRELHAWREGRAESADKPAFRILGNETLLAIAEARPRRLEELARVRGVFPRLKGEAPEILEAVARGLALAEDQLPSIPRSPRPVVTEANRNRIEALRSWRAREAERLGLDVSVVLPQRLVERLAGSPPSDLAGFERIEGLRRWRIDAFGPALIAVLAHG